MPRATVSDILDDCYELIINGASIESCLARYPGQAHELEPLLRAATQLREHGIPPLSKQGMAAAQLKARQALKQQTEHSRFQKKQWILFRQSRLRLRTVGLVIAIMLALLSTSVVVAQRSLPGDWLYPLKRLSEQVRLELASNEVARARLALTFALRRAEETQRIAEQRHEVSKEAISQLTEHYTLAADIFTSLPANEAAEHRQSFRSLIEQVHNVLHSIQPLLKTEDHRRALQNTLQFIQDAQAPFMEPETSPVQTMPGEGVAPATQTPTHFVLPSATAPAKLPQETTVRLEPSPTGRPSPRAQPTESDHPSTGLPAPAATPSATLISDQPTRTTIPTPAPSELPQSREATPTQASTATPTVLPVQEFTPTRRPAPTEIVAQTQAPGATWTPTPGRTVVPTQSPQPSSEIATPISTPSATRTATPDRTAAPSQTAQPSNVPSQTQAPLETQTSQPTQDLSPNRTPNPTHTPASTEQPADTPTPTSAPLQPSASTQPQPTSTPVPTSTPAPAETWPTSVTTPTLEPSPAKQPARP